MEELIQKYGLNKYGSFILIFFLPIIISIFSIVSKLSGLQIVSGMSKTLIYLYFFTIIPFYVIYRLFNSDILMNFFPALIIGMLYSIITYQYDIATIYTFDYILRLPQKYLSFSNLDFEIISFIIAAILAYYILRIPTELKKSSNIYLLILFSFIVFTSFLFRFFFYEETLIHNSSNLFESIFVGFLKIELEVIPWILFCIIISLAHQILGLSVAAFNIFLLITNWITSHSFLFTLDNLFSLYEVFGVPEGWPQWLFLAMSTILSLMDRSIIDNLLQGEFFRG